MTTAQTAAAAEANVKGDPLSSPSLLGDAVTAHYVAGMTLIRDMRRIRRLLHTHANGTPEAKAVAMQKALAIVDEWLPVEEYFDGVR